MSPRPRWFAPVQRPTGRGAALSVHRRRSIMFAGSMLAAAMTPIALILGPLPAGPTGLLGSALVSSPAAAMLWSAVRPQRPQDGTGRTDRPSAVPSPPAHRQGSRLIGDCAPTRPGSVVRLAPGSPRTVALTFDDGPSSWTPQVLDVLQRYQVKAAFFMIGQQAGQDPDAVRQVAAGGHLVGDHTWSHRPPRAGGSWPRAYLDDQVSRTDRLLSQLTGRRPCWFRPPDGVLAGVSTVAVARRLTVAMWSVDTEDWKIQHGARADPTGTLAHRIAAAAIAGAAQPHPVILLHDGGGYRGATAVALPQIIEFYRAHGYQFVRLDGR